MKTISTAIGYIFSIAIFVVGAVVFANNTNIMPYANGNGLAETIAFGVGIMFFGLSGAIYQYNKRKSTKYLFFAFALLAVLSHSIIYTVRTYPNDIVTYTDISLLVAFTVGNMYIFYLSYKHHRES